MSGLLLGMVFGQLNDDCMVNCEQDEEKKYFKMIVTLNCGA